MVGAIVHVLVELEAERIGLGVIITGFLEFADVVHTLGMPFA